MNIVKSEKGSVVVLVALGMVVLLGLTALVIDGGGLYLERARLQKAMDSAVLAGAQELPQRPDLAKLAADKAAELNNVNPADLSITFNDSNTVIRADTTRKKQLTFAHALGFSDSEVEAAAGVQLQPLTSATGIIPLGVDASRQLHYGDPAILKAGDGTNGNFGALQLSGPGANNYRDDLMNGYDKSVSVGDLLNTEKGNVVGPTIQGLQPRFADCPYHGSAAYYDYPKNCPLVVLIPVYQPVSRDQVQVVGFASFFIESVGSSSDGAEVTGRFIRRAFSGPSSGAGGDFGTYGYKLFE